MAVNRYLLGFFESVVNPGFVMIMSVRVDLADTEDVKTTLASR